MSANMIFFPTGFWRGRRAEGKSMLRSAIPLAFLAIAACSAGTAPRINLAMIGVAESSAPAEAPVPDEAPPADSPAPSGNAPGHVALNYLIGKVDPSKDPAFARIPEKYIDGPRVWG